MPPREIILVNKAMSACIPNMAEETCICRDKNKPEFPLSLSFIPRHNFMNSRVTSIYMIAKKMFTVKLILGSTDISPIIIFIKIITFNKLTLEGMSCGPRENIRISRNIFKFNIILML